jgi:hypothetical protein
MNRVLAGFIVLLVAISASGCITSIQDGSPTSHDDTGDGEFVALTSSDSPPNATVVDYSDERIQANKYLTEVVRKAVDNSGKGVVAVPEEKVKETKRDLQKIPRYTVNESNSTNYDWGYYIRYKQTVVRVQFAVLE